MRRSAKYLFVVFVFVAIWAIVAGSGALFREPPGDGAPAAIAAPEPLPTDQIIERVSEGEKAASQVLSWLGDEQVAAAPPSPDASEPAPTEVASVDPPAPSLPPDASFAEEEEADVRGFDPVSPPAARPATNRSFEDPSAEAASAPDPMASGKPRPIDPEALGGVIERLKQSKENGILKPEIPEQMTAFETRRVKIVLARQAAAVDLLSGPEADLDNASELPVRDFMRVELYGGKDFKVEPLIDDKTPHSIKGLNKGEWEFDVTPISGGAHDLEIIVLLYDEPAYLPVARFSQKITVDVPFGSRLKLLWSSYGGEWFLNFLIAPFLAAVAAAIVAVRVDRSKVVARKGPHPGSGAPDIHPD